MCSLPVKRRVLVDLSDTSVLLDHRSVEAAHARLRPILQPTPLIEHPLLNKCLGFRLLLKCENLHPTGSFKLRGASNKIQIACEQKRPDSVVAFSSGNHAQGVAAACHRFKIPATIVMPSDAPAVKRQATENWGAKIIPYDRQKQDRALIAQEIVERSGALLIPPYDDPDVIAGQGITALEIDQQLRQRGLTASSLLIPCGGGGLTSGCAVYLNKHLPDCAVISVEPEGWDDTKRSLEAGKRVRNTGEHSPLCDALLAPTPGALTFALNSKLGVQGVSVTQEHIVAAFKNRFFNVQTGGRTRRCGGIGRDSTEDDTDTKTPQPSGCSDIIRRQCGCRYICRSDLLST